MEYEELSAEETDELALALKFQSLGFQCRKTDLLSYAFRVFCVMLRNQALGFQCI